MAQRLASDRLRLGARRGPRGVRASSRSWVRWSGIDVGPAATGVLAVAALLVAWVVLRGRTPGLGELELPRSGTVARALELASLVLLAVLSIRILRLGAATGLDVWDGWAMWAPKAHALYVEGDVWGPVFTDPAYGMQHEEYPVLLPGLEALASGAIGRFDPPLADIEASVALVAFGWGAWAILRVVVMPAVAAATALVLTGSTPLIENAAAGYADTVVATFTALGLLCLGIWLVKGSGATLVLAGLFLSAAASTKSEGLLFALAAVATAAVVARGFGRSPGRSRCSVRARSPCLSRGWSSTGSTGRVPRTSTWAPWSIRGTGCARRTASRRRQGGSWTRSRTDGRWPRSWRSWRSGQRWPRGSGGRRCSSGCGAHWRSRRSWASTSRPRHRSTGILRRPLTVSSSRSRSERQP